ncbi:MAG: fumarylacetoacetate hydrolase family protein [Thermomicrobiales bacterium]
MVRVVRFLHAEGPKYGAVDPGGSVRSIHGSPFSEDHSLGDVIGQIDDLELLAPCEPTKIICIGRNYASAVRARGSDLPTSPVAFLKTPNSVVGPDANVIRPAGVDEFVYEGELTVIIGERASHVDADDAWDHIFGYTCGNDMTVRDWQATDAHWTRAKASDTLCPLGPWIETEVDPTDLSLKAWVNGELQQDGRTNDLIFSIPSIIEYLTQTITLEPGDAILTGTPLGAQALVDGDVVEVEIEGIGKLRNTIIQAQ